MLSGCTRHRALEGDEGPLHCSGRSPRSADGPPDWQTVCLAALRGPGDHVAPWGGESDVEASGGHLTVWAPVRVLRVNRVHVEGAWAERLAAAF